MLTIVKHLRRDILRPSIIMPDNANSATGLSHLVPDDVTVRSLRPRLDFWYEARLLKGIYLLPRLAKLIRQERPDVVIGSDVRLNLMLIIAGMLSKQRPYLILRHGGIAAMSLEQTKSLGNKLKYHLIKSLYPESDCIISPSQAAKHDAATYLNIPGEKIGIIYNPLDMEYIEHSSMESVEHPWFGEETPLIISVGRLVMLKGMNYLLDAFATVRREIECQLAIVGDGPLRTKLEARARHLGINEHTAFLGWQGNPYKYVAKATLLVHPTLWDGFGYVIVEAMACGTPVVSTRCPGGPPEIITDGRDGLLVPPADSEALSEAILRVLSDKLLRNRLSEQGRERAQDFSADKIVRQYEELILSQCCA